MLEAMESKVDEIDAHPGATSGLGYLLLTLFEQWQGAELHAILLATVALAITFLAYGRSLSEWHASSDLLSVITYWLVTALCVAVSVCLGVSLLAEYLTGWPHRFQQSVQHLEGFFDRGKVQTSNSSVRPCHGQQVHCLMVCLVLCPETDL
jgi:hypothetical protein